VHTVQCKAVFIYVYVCVCTTSSISHIALHGDRYCTVLLLSLVLLKYTSVTANASTDKRLSNGGGTVHAAVYHYNYCTTNLNNNILCYTMCAMCVLCDVCALCVSLSGSVCVHTYMCT
jgi:hypothetical protein